MRAQAGPCSQCGTIYTEQSFIKARNCHPVDAHTQGAISWRFCDTIY